MNQSFKILLVGVFVLLMTILTTGGVQHLFGAVGTFIVFVAITLMICGL